MGRGRMSSARFVKWLPCPSGARCGAGFRLSFSVPPYRATVHEWRF